MRTDNCTLRPNELRARAQACRAAAGYLDGLTGGGYIQISARWAIMRQLGFQATRLDDEAQKREDAGMSDRIIPT